MQQHMQLVEAPPHTLAEARSRTLRPLTVPPLQQHMQLVEAPPHTLTEARPYTRTRLGPEPLWRLDLTQLRNCSKLHPNPHRPHTKAAPADSGHDWGQFIGLQDVSGDPVDEAKVRREIPLF